MRKVYCDFCGDEITTIYHKIVVDSMDFEVCEECNTRFHDKFRRLLNDVRREKNRK